MRRKKGFTLIELIMTIVVVSIIAIPLSLTVFQYIVSFVSTQNLTQAIQIARWDLERISRIDYGDSTMDEGITIISAPYADYGYDVERDINIIQSGTEGLKQIDIRVYPQGTTDTLTTFTTYKAENVSF